ncbi:MAG: hypothetical protein QOK17_995 [Sphingomonadales bacterium]|jgi:hypothetical protein|nr:hypothetical protein [Sphingomonadales bacterium]
MDLQRDGAEHIPAAFTADGTSALQQLLGGHRASVRLKPGSGVSALLGPADALAGERLPGARAVFAKFFDKSRDSNWSLAWHQDRTIAVHERRDGSGFAAWTMKSGIAHAVPPYSYLERMLVLRIHLDETDGARAPLLVAPGSHRLGPIAEPNIDIVVERCGTHACLAAAGDVWAYSAPILHASGPMRAPGRRRVLHLAYSADELPAGLDWLGV